MGKTARKRNRSRKGGATEQQMEMVVAAAAKHGKELPDDVLQEIKNIYPSVLPGSTDIKDAAARAQEKRDLAYAQWRSRVEHANQIEAQNATRRREAYARMRARPGYDPNNPNEPIPPYRQMVMPDVSPPMWTRGGYRKKIKKEKF